jgi:hypothetical protein
MSQPRIHVHKLAALIWETKVQERLVTSLKN